MNKLIFLTVLLCPIALSDTINKHVIILGDKNSVENPFKVCDQWTHELSVVTLSETQYLTNTHTGVSCARTTKCFDISIGTTIEFTIFTKFSNAGENEGVLIEVVDSDGIEIWNKFIEKSTDGWKLCSKTFNRNYKNARVRLNINILWF